jgi:hypothetical protein
MILSLAAGALMVWAAWRAPREAFYAKAAFGVLAIGTLLLGWIDRNGNAAPLWVKLIIAGVALPLAVLSFWRNEMDQREKWSAVLARWRVWLPKAK